MILDFHVTSQDHMIMWFYRQELVKAGYHPAKSAAYKHSGRGDIVILVCRIIDHVI